MNSRELKINIINALRKLRSYKVSNDGIQHIVRCPFCGDSHDITKQHFSIRIDINDDSPMIYNCLHCPVSGLLTNEVLEELDIHIDNELYGALKTYSKKIIKYHPNLEIKTPILEIPYFSKSKLADTKLKYIYERLGFMPTYDDAAKYKLILDIYEFFKFNKIDSIPSNVNFDLLNNNYVGFLSTNNNVITFRNLYRSDKYRYFKLKINPNLVNPNSFYSIPNSLDLLYTEPVNIHIAEGIFDIISIFNNLNDSEIKNNLYYAVCGFGYVAILKYILQLGIITDVNLHIYSDNDKSDKDHFQFLFNQKSNLGLWFDNIYIHRNYSLNQKDYGVNKSLIVDRFRKIK